MARLRQQHPQDYGSSGKISTDFESIVRYINAAELGDKTVAELMAILFDNEGNFKGPIELRLNTTAGLEYRVGTYRGAEDGWLTLVDIDDIRGPAGQNLGLIEGPLFYNRQEITVAVNGTTAIPYTFTPGTEDILVFKNGTLLRGTGVSPEYTYNAGTNTVTLAVAVNTGAHITITSIRGSAVSNYRRLDYVAVSTTPTIAFPHTDDERLLVYKNGLLMREGGSYDYVKSPVTGTITFVTPLQTNDVASVVTVENTAQVAVAGLMLEDEFTDSNGYILWSKISVADGAIAQAKVTGLASALTSKAKITVASVTPSTPSSGDLWLDTSQTPNVLKFYQGTQWLNASPTNALPNFLTGNANQYLRVNGTGTGLEYGTIDNSALVPKTYMGAANGVASLDNNGQLPTSQLPEIFSVDTLDFWNRPEDAAGTVTNKTYTVKTIYKQKVRIDGLSAIMGTGTCTIQIAVDGVAVGSTYAVTTTRSNQNVSPVIEIDATSAGKLLQIIVTSAASTPADLRVGLAVATLST